MAAASAPAQTQRKQQGIFGVNPGKVVRSARPPVSLGVTEVLNTTPDTTFRVSIFPALLTQAPSGGYGIDESKDSLLAASKILTVDTTSFDLAPGKQHAIRVHWNLLPRGSRFAGVAVVVTGRPLIKTNGILPLSRLLQVNLLQLPGTKGLDGKLISVTGAQGPGKTLVFTSRVRNTGLIPGSPARGHVTIADASGKVVVPRLDWGNGPAGTAVVLPGFERDFPATLTKILPAGTYTATSAARFGRRLTRVSQQFTLVGPNELPTVRVAFRGLGSSGFLGQPAKVSGKLVNTGTADVEVGVRLELSRVGRNGQPGKPIAGKTLSPTTLKPGAARAIDEELAKVARGTYVFRLVALEKQKPIAEATTSFVSKKQRSFLDRFWAWVKDHAVLLIVVIALLLIALVAFLAARSRRKLREELEKARAAAAATPSTLATPAVPEPATAPAVNLNAASAQDLATLPGVGPVAASAIVAEREANGPFATVDDLVRVKGFGAARVAALRERISV